MNRRRAILPAVILSVIFALPGCGTVRTDTGGSPELVDISVTTGNDGTESGQYVDLTLDFDRDVTIGKKPLRNMEVTIAGERMKSITFSMAASDKVTLSIPVSAVTRGNLEITETRSGKGYSGITDAEGRYAAMGFHLKTLIPSGVTLEDTGDSAPNRVVKDVKGVWNIRSITWIRLLDNGISAADGMNTESEEMDGAVAVHGHDFLTSDTETITNTIAETLNRHFGYAYVFRGEGTRIIGEKLDGSDSSVLDLEVYSYKSIE